MKPRPQRNILNRHLALVGRVVGRIVGRIVGLMVVLSLSACPDFDTPSADATTDGSETTDARGDDSGANDGGLHIPSDATQTAVPSTHIRIVAANLTSGKKQSWVPGHGQRILKGLAADIILMQEFNLGDKSTANLKAFVKATFGPDFSVFREFGKAIPNGIVSRYPILAAGSWADASVNNRAFAWARIDVPGPIDLWAISIHLLTSNVSRRTKELTQLMGYIKTNIPAADYVVVGGDYNTGRFSESSLQVVEGLLDWRQRPVDQAGNGHTNAKRNKPYDRVFVDPELAAHHVGVKIGAQVFAEGLILDTRVFTPLADVSPALKNDSDAEAMQHMAVVRDFALPK